MSRSLKHKIRSRPFHLAKQGKTVRNGSAWTLWPWKPDHVLKAPCSPWSKLLIDMIDPTAPKNGWIQGWAALVSTSFIFFHHGLQYLPAISLLISISLLNLIDTCTPPVPWSWNNWCLESLITEAKHDQIPSTTLRQGQGDETARWPATTEVATSWAPRIPKTFRMKPHSPAQQVEWMYLV